MTTTSVGIPPSRESDIIRLIFAGIACDAAAACTHPVDTIKVRLQITGEFGRATSQQYNNIFRAG